VKNKKNELIQMAILIILGIAMILSSILPRIRIHNTLTELLEVSVIIREEDSSLWFNTRLGMEQAAEELRVELRFLTLPQANDSRAQIRLLRREHAQGADALVVVPADSSQLMAALTEQNLGCPIVSMESQADWSSPFIAPDNAALGRELAMAALEDWRGGSILLVNGCRSSTGLAIRAEAAQQALLQAGVRVQLETAEKEGELRQLMEETDASGVIVFEPALTEQAAALKESLESEQLLYGVGVTTAAAAYLEKGTISAVAAWSDFVAGYLAVESAVQQVKGSQYQVEPLSFFVVRGDEIYDPKYQKLLFPFMS